MIDETREDWYSAPPSIGAFFFGLVVLGIAVGIGLTWIISELSWQVEPGWRRALPAGGMVLASLLIAGLPILLAFVIFRWRERRRGLTTGWGVFLAALVGAGVGAALFLPLLLVEVRIEPEAVAERQLLEATHMPPEFDLYKEDYAGEKITATQFFVGPRSELTADSIEIPDGFDATTYTRSSQEFPKGWEAFQAWEGPNSLRPGDCILAVDVSRPNVSNLDLEEAPSTARAGIRDGSKVLVYMEASCAFASSEDSSP